MAVGRITGPLLASNLRRDGVNIAVETDLLYIDVVNGRIGIKTDAPRTELDVNGTLTTKVLIADTATIGLVTIESSTSSSTISTLFGDININPGGGDVLNINSDTYVDGDVYATGNFFAQGNVRLGDTTGSDIISFLGEIDTDVLPYISSGTYVTTETEGGTVTNFITSTEIISEYSLGNTSSYWLNSYLDNIFTRRIDTFTTETSTSTTATYDIQFFPDIPLLERTINKSVSINGDIRVYGGSPIGTFPVVNNILYVNENGSDDNDGRAMDSSRACRTITGATRSPYFKQGTIIKVSPGYYAEDNPISLLPYTSVVGDSLRGVFVEPLNNTVDLFHVNSGVYITGMTMLNLSRGEVTRYAPGGAGTYTTGAYCVAFPPSLDNPIDLFHSPYIQNCTNQSGPWLYDGTMFVPNQTVQVPLVVATSTYVTNTTTLFVTIKPEITAQQLEIGMAVNGKGILIDDDIPVATVELIENPDTNFQAAKNLLVLNKEFIKEEVVAWVNFNYSDLDYDEDKCKRDVGIIVDALISDAILGGNLKIVEAGRSYYEGNRQILGNETSATLAAFGRIGELALDVIANTSTVTISTGTLAAQIFDEEQIGGVAASTNITNLVNLLQDILENNGGYENAAALLNANRGFIQAETVAFVNETYVGQPVPSFTYNKSSFFSDVGLIIDAVGNDLIYGGNQQSSAIGSIKAGSVTSSELDETVAGYTYLASIVRDVLLNNQFNDGYQNTVTQIVSTSTVGTNAAVELITNNIALINGLIQGTFGLATPTVVNNGPITEIQSILDSYNLLVANKEFLQHEVVSYIDVTFTNLDFEYNAEKCERDTGLIVDSLAMDLLYQSNSNSTFAGLQYWNQDSFASEIAGEITTTTNAFSYASNICQDIVQNSLITPYQTEITQDVSTTASTITSAISVAEKFNTIINIITNGPIGVSDEIVPNGPASTEDNTVWAFTNLKVNKPFIQEEVIAWVEANKSPGFEYDQEKCRRDAGYIVDCVALDILHGGNRQSVQAGVYYYGYDSTSTVLVNEIPQTVLAYAYMKQLIEKVVQRIPATKTYQSIVEQNLDTIKGTLEEARFIRNNIDVIRNIIKKGPDEVPTKEPLPLISSSSTNVINAYNLLIANKEFIQAEVVAYVDTTFIQPYEFRYNESKCFRDMGLIVDAISFDITRRSNVNSLEAGLAYWDGAVSAIDGQINETAGAIQYAKKLALKIIANNPVTSFFQESVEFVIPGTSSTTSTSLIPQIINPELNGGGIARELVDNNFNAITTIIKQGPAHAPYSTGSTLTEFIVHISTSTIKSAKNDILYFGETTVYPVEDKKMPGEWEENGFADRRINPRGSGGGALVDGNAPSLRSPIQSFVFDAFTQITQGGPGIHIINQGYAQLVSVFTIFCDQAVTCENGGIASVTNSNNNFGDLTLLAKGYGPRKFGGTIYNPKNIAYNPLDNVFEPNEYYPLGYFPTSQQICVFVPNSENRPHISLVMEIQPPDRYIDYDNQEVPYVNPEGFPGFLTAIANTTTLTTSSYTISGIDTTGISIGQTVYIRDQFGYEADNNGEGDQYINTGTTIVDITFQTIHLSEPINQGGGQYDNPFYFNIYACGNAYYNVLTSQVAGNPYPTGQSKILGQETETIAAINFMGDLTKQVVQNILVTSTYSTLVSQVIDTGLPGGDNAVNLIDTNIGIITNVILSGPQAAPEIRNTGTVIAFKDNIVELLEKNRYFIMDEVVGYVDVTFGGFVYDEVKCERDAGLIVDSIAFDLLYQGSTQSAFAGLQYWNQDTYTGSIQTEITTTTAAINYAKGLAVTIVQNAGGSTPAQNVSDNFDIIINILENGTIGVSDLIVPNGVASNSTSIISSYDALISNKASIQTNTINWINSTYPDFGYDSVTCERDIGYIIDSIAFDLLHGGNGQSVMSGVYYYGFDSSSTAIPNEIPQTTAAYNFIKAIVGDIITGTPISPRYQTTISQITNLEPATDAESIGLRNNLDLITDIINNGPSAAPEQEPIGLVASSNTNVANAFALLMANRNFIQAEVIAFVNNEFIGFEYNRQKCRRDVGLIINALQADILTGGNFRAVEAAKTYYSKEGTYHIVTLEDNVRDQLLFVDGSTVNFYQRSYMSASGYLFEYCGAGTNYGALPQVGRVDPNQSKEVVQLNNGKVFFTSTDQNGDFRIGPGLVISQATGVLSGRTFEKSLFAQMTPFILAVESGGSE
jgi:hypothetical protein